MFFNYLNHKGDREYFMESAGVRYLHKSCWQIEQVRFLIQKQQVGA